jgi:hypothetical protein
MSTSRRRRRRRFVLCLQKWSVPALILDVLLLAAIITQAVIYVLQWHVMQQQLSQAKAIQEVSDRPWIVVKTITAKNALKKGERFEATIQYVNTGRTPANNTTALVWVNIMNATSAKDLKRSDISGMTSAGVVAPGALIAEDINVPLETVEEYEQVITDKTFSLYIFGTVTYDIPNGRGQTDFCYLNDPGTINFLAYKEGNYAK